MTDPADKLPTEIDPQDAFQLFSHELRLQILFALWEAPEYSLPFTEIRTAVGERDSGKFTYHLEKLTDHFVVEVEGQYVLQYAGHRVIDAIQSGVFHASPTIAAVDAPGSCAHCGDTPTFSYEDHLATVSCDACETKLVEYPFEPGGFQDRTVADAIRAFDQYTKSKWRLTSNKLCFVCGGRVSVSYTDTTAEMERHDRYENFFASDHPALFHLSCQNCSFYSYIPVGIRLLDDSSVLGQPAMQGEITDRPLWELPFVIDADRLTVQSTDPWQVLVEASTPDGQLGVTLDSAAEVESVTVQR